ncbi:MAG: hypothetical protein U1F43_38925 [Myxococcota bacterium]
MAALVGLEVADGGARPEARDRPAGGRRLGGRAAPQACSPARSVTRGAATIGDPWRTLPYTVRTSPWKTGGMARGACSTSSPPQSTRMSLSVGVRRRPNWRSTLGLMRSPGVIISTWPWVRALAPFTRCSDTPAPMPKVKMRALPAKPCASSMTWASLPTWPSV